MKNLQELTAGAGIKDENKRKAVQEAQTRMVNSDCAFLNFTFRYI